MEEEKLLNCELVDEQFLADLPGRKKPVWVELEPLTFVGAWEPLFHRRRCGETWVRDEEYYAYEHSEQYVREVLEMGGNIIITAYDKNYHVDEDEYRLKKHLAALCKKHGLRLAAYIRSDQIYAEYFREFLDKTDVLGRRADGRIPTYGAQEWRKNICFHKTGPLDLMKKNVQRAVMDLGVDLIVLDGFEVGGTETVDACRCDACRKDFTKFLTHRYGDNLAASRRRFGHTHLDAIEPPGMIFQPAAPSGLITDPVWQEWIIFRCTWTTRFAREISGYVYHLNPEVAISVNNGVQAKENFPLMSGADLSSYGRCIDILFNESGYHPSITAEGRILQHVREYKMTGAADCFGWTHIAGYGSDPRRLQIEMAHAAAFNRGRVSELGFAFSCYDDFRKLGEIKKAFLSWQRGVWEHYQNLKEIVYVAVWRERKTMAFASPLTYASAMQVEQLLIEDRIPFTVSQQDWQEDARVVILPGLTCFDETRCRKVMEFVENGGSVMIIGNTSLRDGWGRKRDDFGLRPILPDGVAGPIISFQQHIAGVNVPVQSGTEQFVDEEFRFRKTGKGRVAYISNLVDINQPSPFNPDHTFNMSLDTTNWRIPKKAEELRMALGWLGDNRWSIRVKSKRGVLANYYRQTTTGNISVHLVNLTGATVVNTVIRLEAKTRGDDVIEALSPDGDTGRNLTWKRSGNELTIVLQLLKVYTVIIVKNNRLLQRKDN